VVAAHGWCGIVDAGSGWHVELAPQAVAELPGALAQGSIIEAQASRRQIEQVRSR
jgi:hypothetical protein